MVEVLALIPARGGSKGVPGKNIKPLGGYPLISFSIAAAHRADLVNRTIVSTDAPEIAAVAQQYGAEVPFLRPAEFARDDTPDLPVFQHALRWLEEQEGYRPQLVVQLRPTSPFRPPEMVDRAVQRLLAHPDADSLRGVVPAKQNPYKMWQIDQKGFLLPILETEFQEPFNMPRQKLPPTYWQTGHIDVIRSDTILAGSMSGSRIISHRIDARFSVDLDNLKDWQRSAWMLEDLFDQIVIPPGKIFPFPEKVSLLVLDFDGVMTDDRVYVDQQGKEMVAAHRGDGMGIALLKKAGVEVMILSTEKNPVVSARAAKLDLPVHQGIDEKGAALQALINEKGFNPEQVVYLGNDLNDLACFPLVGTAAAVADAHPLVRSQADLVLEKRGGEGAVRELCELILKYEDKLHG